MKTIANVPPENNFWVCDGSVLKNIQELQRALQQMSDSTYTYHVNQEKNDFANWVNDVIQHSKLSEKLRSAKSKQEAANIVKKVVKAAGKK